MTATQESSKPYALNPGEGWTYQMGIDFTLKARERRPGSGSAVLEYKTRKGEEPDPHTHPTEDEMFYVLEGEITFHCDGQSFDLGQGGFIFLPCGSQHSYTIRQDPVRLLVITSPVRETTGWGGFAGDMEGGD